MDDERAVRRLKRGDIGGLETLVRRYQVRALRTAYLITQDRGRAEEVVQDAFIRVYQHIDQFDASRPFAPWFLRSVANAAVRVAQRNQRQAPPDTDIAWEDVLPDPAAGPESAAEAAELAETVRAALLALSPEQRAAVVLRYYLGYTTAEIAEETDTPAGTVKWRLHSARQQLRLSLRNLKEQFNG